MAQIPTSIWNGGEGDELTPSGNLPLTSEAGLELISEAGLVLVQDDTIDTPTPATVWITDNSM